MMSIVLFFIHLDMIQPLLLLPLALVMFISKEEGCAIAVEACMPLSVKVESHPVNTQPITVIGVGDQGAPNTYLHHVGKPIAGEDSEKGGANSWIRFHDHPNLCTIHSQ